MMIEIDEEMRDNWIQYLKKTTDMQDDEIKVKINKAIADVMRFARENSAVQIIKLHVVFFPKDGGVSLEGKFITFTGEEIEYGEDRHE